MTICSLNGDQMSNICSYAQDLKTSGVWSSHEVKILLGISQSAIIINTGGTYDLSSNTDQD